MPPSNKIHSFLLIKPLILLLIIFGGGIVSCSGETQSNNLVDTPSDLVNTPPELVGCPTNIVRSAASGTTSAVVSWDPPTATDVEDGNLPPEAIVADPLPGSIFVQGPTAVVYTATDSAGGIATCSFVVTILNDLPPSIENCPDDQRITVLADAPALTTVTWDESSLQVSDREDVPATLASSLIRSHVSGSQFPVGSTEVTFSVMDSAGNTGNCSFIITIRVNTPPAFINCPGSGEVPVNAGSVFPTQVGWTELVAIDNEDIPANLMIISSHAPGDLFDVGDTEVTYTVTDSNEAMGTCLFTISVVLEYPQITLVNTEEERILITEVYAPSDTVTLVEVYIQKAPPLPASFEPGTSARYITLDRVGMRSPASRPGLIASYRDIFSFNYDSFSDASEVRLYEGDFYTLAFVNGIDFLVEDVDFQVSWPDGVDYALPSVAGDCVAIELTLLTEAGIRETQDLLQAGSACDLTKRGLDWNTEGGTLSIPGAGQSLARNVRPSDEVAGFAQSLGLFNSSHWTVATMRTPRYPTDATCISGGNTADGDEDGISDCLEALGETYFGMSFYDWGARISQKDIFVEVDYMPCSITGDLRTQPDKETFERVQDQFDSYTQNGTNLALHMDVGDLFNEAIHTGFNLGGGNSVISNADERSDYWGVTLDTELSSEGVARYYSTKESNFAIVRKPFFHYMLFAETQEDDGGRGRGIFGIGEIGGNDTLITLGGGGSESVANNGLDTFRNCDINNPQAGNQNAPFAKNLYQNNQAFTVLHELGHNLGLRHGGASEDNFKPNYFSIMNYLYGNYGPPSRTNEGETTKRVRDAYYYRHSLSLGTSDCYDGEAATGSNFTGITSGTRNYGETQEAHVLFEDIDNFDLHFSSGGNSDIRENSINENSFFDIKQSGGGTWSMPLDIDCDGVTNAATQADVNFDETNTDALDDHDDISAIRSFFARSFSGNAGQATLQTGTSVSTRQTVSGKRGVSAEGSPKLMFQGRRQYKRINDRQPVVPTEEERRPDMIKMDFSSSTILDHNRHSHE